MLPDTVVSVIVGVAVFGGLAFHDAIVARIAAIDRDPELVDSGDVDR